MQTSITGLALIGKFEGIRQRQVTNRTTGEVTSFSEAGFTTVVENGFGGSAEELTLVQLTKAQIAEGVGGKLAQYIGKTIAVPVWVRAYPLNGGKAGNNFYLANDWQQHIAVVSQPLAKSA